MAKMKLVFVACVVVLLVAASLTPAGAQTAKKVLYIGGTMSLTGPYAEDSAAVLAGFQDYVRYVNETKKMAPWRKERFPTDITLELLWRDDELQPAKALSIYEELKAKGILVYRCSGSPIALALKSRLMQDNMGATSMATGPYLLNPPQTVFSYYPLYTDSVAAIADWFKANWKEKRKPRVAFLTSDNAMGKSIEIPEMRAYLDKLGYEFVGSQYVPLVATSAPTTQLMWLKDKGVDLTLGVLINPNAQPIVKEMVRLGIGPFQKYKMTVGTATPGHIAVFADAMGKLGDGYVCAGSYPNWDDQSIGVQFEKELQGKYHPTKFVRHIQYMGGMVEAMTQTEALRLALLKTPYAKLTSKDVLINGFYQIKNLNTGGITPPLSYGPGLIEGVNKVRVDQLRDGKVVNVGNYPTRHIYTR